MSGKQQEYSVEELVKAFINERDVYTSERILDDLASRTHAGNLNMILEIMRNQPNIRELDISVFVYWIASPEFTQLKEVIANLRKSFTDEAALDDLNGAEKKLKG